MLQTNNLHIRPHSVSDASIYFPFTLRNQEYLSESFPRTVGSIRTLKALERHYKWKDENWRENKEFACAICSKKDESPVGYISVKNIDWDIPKGELAYFIFQEYAGKGFATEALSAFRDWCFLEKKFNRLYAKIITDNEASIKVVERCGFQFEGLLKKDYSYGDGRLVDVKIYGATT